MPKHIATTVAALTALTITAGCELQPGQPDHITVTELEAPGSTSPHPPNYGSAWSPKAASTTAASTTSAAPCATTAPGSAW